MWNIVAYTEWSDNGMECHDVPSSIVRLCNIAVEWDGYLILPERGKTKEVADEI